MKLSKLGYSFIFFASIILIFVVSRISSSQEYDLNDKSAAVATKAEEPKPEVVHLKTPEPLKAVYMTSCIASLPKERSKMVKLIEETELNAIVVDIKDYSGVVSYTTGNAEIDKVSFSAKGCRVDDMREFVQELHDKDIYVVGRVTVFQDPLYTKMYPEVAVKSKSKRLPDGSQGVWRDRKGLAFVDVGAERYWQHVLAIATTSYALGFDEINFDYIRFPSDGDMDDANYTYDVGKTKRQALKEFFEYVNKHMTEAGITSSADLFGMTTTADGDLGIGQVLEYALMNFDYVAPMVYPSHYPPHFNGWKDPNKVPYELIKFVMNGALTKSNRLYVEVSTSTASSTPNQALMKRVKPTQLRPWLQDFDYPVPYTADMVRKQIQATYDVGLTSWMLWDPSNKYTPEALLED